jgi:Ca2+-binding EF-hand superfamily protein
MDDSGDG